MRKTLDEQNLINILHKNKSNRNLDHFYERLLISKLQTDLIGSRELRAHVFWARIREKRTIWTRAYTRCFCVSRTERSVEV
jgi:hypothetical protein